jgi:REP element-mobilizing transposase RayT
MDDHAHLLLSLPSTMAVATAMREIKSASSHWMHQDCALPNFAWQEGYGAFSIGSAQIGTTSAYIANQVEHHRKRDFQSEFLAMLKKQGIAYDLRFVWE